MTLTPAQKDVIRALQSGAWILEVSNCYWLKRLVSGLPVPVTSPMTLRTFTSLVERGLIRMDTPRRTSIHWVASEAAQGIKFGNCKKRVLP